MIKQLFLFLFWLLIVAGFGCTNESPWDKSMTEIEEAIEFADESVFPDPEMLYQDVYYEGSSK